MIEFGLGLIRYINPLLGVLFIYYGCRIYSSDDKETYIKKQRNIILIFHLLGAVLIYAANKNDSSIVFLLILQFVFIIVGWSILQILFVKSDFLLWNIIFFFLDISMLVLLRLSHEEGQKQTLWIFIGFIAIIGIKVIGKWILSLEKLQYIYLGLTIVFLSLPFFIGVERYGALNWVHIGPIGFQPSEVVKIFYVLFLASLFAKVSSIKYHLLSIIVSISCLFILVMQKDLGASLIYFLTFIILYYLYSKNEILTIIGFGAAGLSSVIAYRLFPHIQVRVEAWMNPWQYMDTKGYQITQSLFAICEGGWIGKGLTKGLPESVPMVSTDFIFSAIAEELGNIFSISVIILYIMLIYGVLKIAKETTSLFQAYIVIGFSSLLTFQSFLILGGVTKLLPLTGVTLPLISYGGSSILTYLCMMGMIQLIKEMNNESSEKEESHINQEGGEGI